MSVARHPRPPELEGVPIEEIMARHVGHFRDKKPDWAAFMRSGPRVRARKLMEALRRLASTP